MFYYLEGAVALMDVNLAVIDVNGIGFKLFVTNNTQSYLEIGKKSKLYVYTNIKEDAFDLFGFHDLGEKRCFEMLLSVSGVGPKAALAILSAVTPEQLALAIATENDKMLTAAPGIGKRIAQRIILELKDKITKEQDAFSGGSASPAVRSAVPSSKLADVNAALTVLGYSPSEITSALKGVDIDNLSIEECIRVVLKNSVK